MKNRIDKKANTLKSANVRKFFAGLWCFLSLNSVSDCLKPFVKMLVRLGAWNNGNEIIPDQINYKYDNVLGLHQPYDSHKEPEEYSKQLYSQRDRYRAKIMTFIKRGFPYFVSIISIGFNIAQCVTK
jgi:hypothetical protein